MRVLFIHCAYQLKSGEDAVVKEEIGLLRDAGVEVELLLFENQHHTMAKLLQMPFNGGAYKRTRKKINAFAPDVVHIHNLHFAASPSVIYAVKHSGLPLVCTLHNFRLLCPSAILFHNGRIFLDSLHQTFPWTAIKKGVFRNSRLLTAWMALSMQAHRLLRTWTLPDRYIVLSGHAQDILTQSKLKLRKGQLLVKPNCCSLPEVQPLKKTDIFLFAGRLCEDKGVPLLLQAFAGAPFKLIIAGDGPLREEVVQFSNNHPNITYAGALHKEALLELMQCSTALIFPSIWFEGMPLTIIEAFACGLPVIASRLGVMERMITPEYNGLLFDAGDGASLATAVNTWMHLPDAQKNIFSINARSTYDQFYTQERNAALLMDIYASVQSKAAPAPVAVAH